MSRAGDSLARAVFQASARKTKKGAVSGIAAPMAQMDPLVDAITFIEKVEWGLRMDLYPVQRVIIKAHYGIPLDNEIKFEVANWNRTKVQEFTEVEYLEYLFHERRSNIRTVIPGQERRKLVLSIGRRSGKSTLAAAIMAYEVYRLIHKIDPHNYYKIALAQYFSLIAVATGREQASELYGKVSGNFAGCAFFRRYQAAVTQTSARFQTPSDMERYGSVLDNPKARASIRVSFQACNAKGLRGKGNIVVVLDEFAHFNTEGGSSDEEVYTALSASTSDFSPKSADGKSLHGVETQSEARILMISSPLGKQGLFYRQYEQGFRGDRAAENMLCIQAPTWEVNPTIPPGEFQQKAAENLISFFTEYGADFSDRSLGWIEEKQDLMACIEPSARPVLMGNPRVSYYLGFDLGLVNDPSAVAIVHNEADRTGKVHIVLDFIDQIQAKKGKFASADRLDFDQIADWLLDLSKRFHIKEGLFDQWNHIPLEQALLKRGLGQLKAEYMASQLNSQIYQNLKAQMWDQKIRLYDLNEHDREILRGKGEKLPDVAPFAPYLVQLLELQAEVKSKYIIDVRAKPGPENHDDLADALARAVWLASQHLGKANVVSGGSSQDRMVFPTQHGVAFRDRAGTAPARQIVKPRRTMLSGLLNFKNRRF